MSFTDAGYDEWVKSGRPGAGEPIRPFNKEEWAKECEVSYCRWLYTQAQELEARNLGFSPRIFLE